MNKKILIPVAVLAVIVGSYVALNGTARAPEGVSSESVTYEWHFTELEADESGMPHTAVGLTTGGRTYAVGTYAGSCYEVKAEASGVLGEKADAAEVARVQCWFAGGGDEIGVFRTGTKTIIKVGELGEGDAEQPAFRGNFKTILEL